LSFTLHSAHFLHFVLKQWQVMLTPTMVLAAAFSSPERTRWPLLTTRWVSIRMGRRRSTRKNQPCTFVASSVTVGSASPPSPAFSNMVFAPFWSGYKSHPQRQANPVGAASDSSGEEDAPVDSTTAATTTTASSSSSTRTVRFDRDVLVVPIPSRHAYSDRIQKAFWRKGNELQETVNRNRYEFTVEGWDWNTVLEDEEMYIDVATGEKIHPCWVEGSDEGQVVG